MLRLASSAGTLNSMIRSVNSLVKVSLSTPSARFNSSTMGAIDSSMINHRIYCFIIRPTKKVIGVGISAMKFSKCTVFATKTWGTRIFTKMLYDQPPAAMRPLIGPWRYGEHGEKHENCFSISLRRPGDDPSGHRILLNSKTMKIHVLRVFVAKKVHFIVLWDLFEYPQVPCHIDQVDEEYCDQYVQDQRI